MLTSEPLSLSNPYFRTCIFDPSYSIVHFPMYHFPSNGHVTAEIKTQVSKSQFQLMHTILAYHRSFLNLSVFDENFVIDDYTNQYFQSFSPSDFYRRIDNKVFPLEETQRKAQHLFAGGIPKFYEHLNAHQKELLFDIGASLTLYLLGQIPRIHKVISEGNFLLAKNKLLGPDGRFYFEGNDYWVYDFREQELKKEVLNFFHANPGFGKVILIAYGASHDLSDEFVGYPFQSGHNFCLNWNQHSENSSPVLF